VLKDFTEAFGEFSGYIYLSGIADALRDIRDMEHCDARAREFETTNLCRRREAIVERRSFIVRVRKKIRNSDIPCRAFHSENLETRDALFGEKKEIGVKLSELN